MCWSENMLPPNLMLTVIIIFPIKDNTFGAHVFRHIGLKFARNLDGPWDQRFLVSDL